MQEVLLIRPDRCKACGLCKHFCPKAAIHELGKLNSLGYRPMSIDPVRCSKCGLCKVVCPDWAVTGMVGES